MAREGGDLGQLVSNPAFFHYNHVDGVYLGLGHDWRVSPRVAATTKLGYGLGSEIWQYRLGAQADLTDSRRQWAGAWYHDETITRPTLISGGYNPTFRALFARTDPLDYYRERGLTLSLGTRLFDFTRFELRYDDLRQSTLDTVPPFFRGPSRSPPRDNPPIVDGTMRTLSGTLTLDSRRMMRREYRDYPLGSSRWTRLTLGAEIAEPALIPDDFTFRRYTMQLAHQRPLLGLGITTVTIAGGTATGTVPPQRYFTVDFGQGILAADGSGFNTLRRTSYSGNRVAMFTLRHDFDRRFFARTGIPLLRSIPSTLSIQGGAFLTDFVDHQPVPGDSLLVVASRPYREIGFSLGNLTPFLSPFNFTVQFTWQLSSYPTDRFRFGIGLTGF
jgi:hypothetical protein